MLSAVWTKTLRELRVPILGWGLGLGLSLYANYATARDAIASGIAGLAKQFRFMAEPVAVDTVPGYVTFRVLGLVLPVLLSIWAILVGARLVRGEEERGSLDVLLSTPRSRARLLAEKLAALAGALLGVALLLSLGVLAGQAGADQPLAYGRALGATLNASLVALVFGAAGLLLSQLLPRRAAAGMAAMLLALAFLTDATGRTVAGAGWLRLGSPLHYYTANKPLIPGYPADPGAAAVLIGVCLALAAGSLLLFARRDIDGVALLALPGSDRRAHGDTKQVLARAWGAVWERPIGLRALRAEAPAALWWTLAVAAFAGWMTLLVPTVQEPLQQLVTDNPLFAELFARSGLGTDAGVLALAPFLFLPAVLAVFALTQALAWPADLDARRLEVVLSTPRSRGQLLLERFLAVLVMALASTLVVFLVVLAGVRVAGLSIGIEQLAAACLAIVPLQLLTATLVYALAGRLPYGAVVGVVVAFLVAGFLAEFLRQTLDLPGWLVDLSMFHQYGSPLTDGLASGSFLAMLSIAAALLGLGTVQFRRADLVR
jgi:polyether ionophore transport system permease protein